MGSSSQNFETILDGLSFDDELTPEARKQDVPNEKLETKGAKKGGRKKTVKKAQRNLEPICIFESLQVDAPVDRIVNTVFDIETGPAPWSLIETMYKYVPPADFDPSSVKTGDCDRVKDFAERERRKAEKIRLAKEKHDEMARNHRQEWADGIVSSAALDASIGRTLAIGYSWSHNGKEGIAIDGVNDEPEEDILHRFWCHFLWTRSVRGKIGGHCVKSFDVPWIIRRSIVHRETYPQDVLSQGRYLDRLFFDSNEKWSAGEWKGGISLNHLAAVLGCRLKVDHTVTGETFHVFWGSDRQKAIEYLTGDVLAELDVCNAMNWE